jgi:Helix-turn-helix domain
MDRELLRAWLERGMSLAEIGALVERDPTTVSYWLKKHGLKANGHDKHAPKGVLTREQLEPLVEAGLTLEEIGARLHRGARTIRTGSMRTGYPSHATGGGGRPATSCGLRATTAR